MSSAWWRLFKERAVRTKLNIYVFYGMQDVFNTFDPSINIVSDEETY
jgi:hypothetical protein